MPAATQSQERTLASRFTEFLGKPWSAKVEAIRFRLLRPFRRFPRRTKLPWGGVWVVWPDKVSGWAASGEFETGDPRFVERFLEPGMTFLDIGAHYGLYSLLASRRVGTPGHIEAFEPSVRERNRLRLNLLLNRSRNVRVHSFALGAEPSEADFYRVDGGETGCNSLRPPAVDGSVRRLRVRVKTLDDFLRREEIKRIDFIKLDVEGAEWSVLRGAADLLVTRPRPVILMELSDLRTAAWGYSSSHLMSLVEALGFRWFETTTEGRIIPAGVPAGPMDANRIAVPEERLADVVRRFSAGGSDLASQTSKPGKGSC